MTTTNNPNVLEARITHIFSAPVEKVFDAWLDPQILGRWMFGPAVRDEEVVSIEVDPKPGGAFSFLVKRDVQVVEHIGTYIIIDKPRTLEFNWGVKGMSDNSKVIVTFEAHDTGTKLTLVHELHPSWEAYLQRSVDGWGLMLKALEKALLVK